MRVRCCSTPARIRRSSGSCRTCKIVGPSLAGIAASDDEDERTRLLEAQVLNVLVGNAACHGKNSSVLHLPDGTIRLAPYTT